MDFRQAFERSATPMLAMDAGLVIIQCNSALEQTFALPRERMLGQPFFDVFPGCRVQAQIFAASLQRVLNTGLQQCLTMLEYNFSTSPLPVSSSFWHLTSSPLLDDDGAVNAILLQPVNISDLVAVRGAEVAADLAVSGSRPLGLDLQHLLTAERERVDRLFQQSPGFICVLRGPELIFELANDAYYQLIGHRQVIGFRVADVLPELIDQGFVRLLHRAFQTGEPYVGRAVPIDLQREAAAPREGRFIDLVYQPLRDGQGQITGLFIQGHDVTDAHRLSRDVAFQAAHDLLTGLYNRRELTRQMAELEQCSGSHVLLYLDIDHFKIVNDRCGHAAGDALLVELAQLLCTQVSSPNLLARIGGDEFAVVLPHSTLEQAAALAEQLRSSARQLPFIWDGRRYSITLSIGIASFGNSSVTNFSDGLGRADAACFLAKEKGRNQAVLSVPADEEVRRHQLDMDWTERLRESMREDRVVLFGQRFSYLGDDSQQAEWTCYEILTRLRGIGGELIAPGAFIPAAERFGLVAELDRHIITQAFVLLQQLEPAIRRRTRYFINVSGLTLNSPGFVDDVLAILTAHPGVLPANICFEITETVAIRNLSLTGQLLEQLAEHGFRFALDDFGSGMSSFGYLQQLPVHYLKVDGDLIRAIRTPPVGSLIVESMIRVAQALNIQVIAESVEWIELVPELKAIGADYGQGFALHRPEPLPVQG